MAAIGKKCDGTSGEHDDATNLVLYLINLGGGSPDPNDKLAAMLFPLKHGQPDTGRFYRARNHVRDRVDDMGVPCCGFMLHYRGTHNSSLELIDAHDKLANRAKGAWQSLGGYIVRERQHHTENLRQVRTFQQTAEECVTAADSIGAQVNFQAAHDIETYGTVLPATMAVYEVWLQSL